MLAPLLFSIFFSMMLLVAFKDCDLGVPIHFRIDGSGFSLRRLQARPKVFSATIRDLLFADDCALIALLKDSAQQLFDHVACAACRFGLTVSLKKTELVFQPSSSRHTAPVINAGDTVLKVVYKFCYLCSVLSTAASIDVDISARLATASAAYGRLTKRLCNDHGIRLRRRLQFTRQLCCRHYCMTLHRRHMAKPDQFHRRAKKNNHKTYCDC